jgi:hypothetical protein
MMAQRNRHWDVPVKLFLGAFGSRISWRSSKLRWAIAHGIPVLMVHAQYPNFTVMSYTAKYKTRSN